MISVIYGRLFRYHQKPKILINIHTFSVFHSLLPTVIHLGSRRTSTRKEQIITNIVWIDIMSLWNCRAIDELFQSGIHCFEKERKLSMVDGRILVVFCLIRIQGGDFNTYHNCYYKVVDSKLGIYKLRWNLAQCHHFSFLSFQVRLSRDSSLSSKFIISLSPMSP